jgi:hypothetical protein
VPQGDIYRLLLMVSQAAVALEQRAVSPVLTLTKQYLKPITVSVRQLLKEAMGYGKMGLSLVHRC